MSVPVFGVRVEIALNTHGVEVTSAKVTSAPNGAVLNHDDITELIKMLRNAQATIRRGNRK